MYTFQVVDGTLGRSRWYGSNGETLKGVDMNMWLRDMKERGGNGVEWVIFYALLRCFAMVCNGLQG